MVTDQQVQAYLNDFLDDEAEQESKLKDKGSVYKWNNSKLRVSKFQ